MDENGLGATDKPDPEDSGQMDLPPKQKRTGKTREHYNKQKSQAFSYFRIDAGDASKMKGSQFTIYNFINNSFSFSQTKKELAIQVLEELKKGPVPFIQLQKKLGAKKSTLYMLILALQKSGLVAPTEKNASLTLSNSFSEMLSLYSDWWARWLRE
ncbi:MAG TPA: hypothetical protein VJI13_03310 [Candidatus Norongarragalinales archaeon]|nr:hypothetical protein [Candidatus Norongarragalinales archaeon]